MAKIEPVYAPLVFDDLTLQNHFLPQLYKQHQQGQIDVYIHTEGNIANIYILDENGALFHATHTFYNIDTIMAHYDAFLYAITQRINSIGYDTQPMRNLSVRFFTLRQSLRCWDTKPFYIDHMQTPISPVDVTVIIELVDHQPQYHVFCNDQEFSSLQYGEQLFTRLAEHILSLRVARNHYPLYINDIDIPFQTNLEEPDILPQSINYLQHKILFETRLNAVLNQLYTLQTNSLT